MVNEIDFVDTEGLGGFCTRQGTGYISQTSATSFKKITIAVWVYSSTIAGYTYSVSKASAYNLAWTYSDTKPHFITSTNGSQFNHAISSDAVTANTWTHICGTYDGVTAKVYVNGVLKGQDGTWTGNLGANANNLYISSSAGTTHWVYGCQKDVKIWTDALTDAEVLRVYQGDKNVKIDSLAHDFNFQKDYTDRGLRAATLTRTNPVGGVSYLAFVETAVRTQLKTYRVLNGADCKCFSVGEVNGKVAIGTIV